MAQADAAPGSEQRDAGARGPGGPGRRPVWVAAGFLLALALTVATVILTGLLVGGQRSASGDGVASWQRAAEPAESRPGAPAPRAADGAEGQRAARSPADGEAAR